MRERDETKVEAGMEDSTNEGSITSGIFNPAAFSYRPHREVRAGVFVDIALRRIPDYYAKHVDKLGTTDLGVYSVTSSENALGDVMLTVWQKGSDGVRHAVCDTVKAQSILNADDPTVPLTNCEASLVRYLYSAALIRAGADPKSIGVPLPGFEEADKE
jgi:hypothetical protein